jgi:hypothetical protein
MLLLAPELIKYALILAALVLIPGCVVSSWLCRIRARMKPVRVPECPRVA